MATAAPNPSLAEVLDAVEDGDVDTVCQWLERGGDPNEALTETVDSERFGEFFPGETPLMIAAMAGRVEVIQSLLLAGADVNFTRTFLVQAGEPEGETQSALTMALKNHHPEAAQLLLDQGADRTAFQWKSSKVTVTVRHLRDHRILRMFYIAGVDLSGEVNVNGTTFEEHTRQRLMTYSQYPTFRRKYATMLKIIDGVRLAGSYKEFILRDYKQLLRMRSLLARGRATMSSSGTEVIARLFGGTASATRRPQTRRSRAPPECSVGVPDPIFWKVMEFYRLGDWRRPCTLAP